MGSNLAALALLGAVLSSGTEPGGLAVAWPTWLVPCAVFSVLGLAVFRFPRSLGLPLVLVSLGVIGGGVQAFQGWREPGALALPEVHPGSDRELVTAFTLRYDAVDFPSWVPLVPERLARLRVGASTDPTEPWWSWLVSWGWARSWGAELPPSPLKWGVYQLNLTDGPPQWRLIRPELTPPPLTLESSSARL